MKPAAAHALTMTMALLASSVPAQPAGSPRVSLPPPNSLDLWLDPAPSPSPSPPPLPGPSRPPGPSPQPPAADPKLGPEAGRPSVPPDPITSDAQASRPAHHFDLPEDVAAGEAAAAQGDGALEPEVWVLEPGRDPAKAGPVDVEAAPPDAASSPPPPAADSAPGEATASSPAPSVPSAPATATTSGVASRDFFAGDPTLTRAVVRAVEAILRAERPDQSEALNDLLSAHRALDSALNEARGQGVGPLAEDGNQSREAFAALSLIHMLISERAQLAPTMGKIMAQARIPDGRFSSRDLGDVPLVLRGDPTRRVIALTFDDGPTPPGTDRTLEVLSKYGVRGTFFLLGKNVERFPALARRVVAEGHEVAHHSYSHPWLNKISNAQILKEIERTDRAFARVLPEVESVQLFRLPFNGGSRSRRVHSVLGKRYRYLIGWSVDSDDYQEGPVERVLAKLDKRARHNGAIVLFHDRTGPCAPVLDQLIPRFQRDGYRFVTVSEILGDDEAGRRGRRLHAALGQIAERRFTAAARTLANFTLRHRHAQVAPAALFTSYLCSQRAKREKADKLRQAMVRRYPQSLFTMALQGRLPSWQDFVPGGRIEPPAKTPPPLPPGEDPAPGPRGPPDTARAAAGAPAGPAAPDPEAGLGLAAPPGLEAPRAARPGPPPGTNLAARVAARWKVSRALRPPSRGPRTPDPELARQTARLPGPYRDPAPELDGSHLIDDGS